MRRNTQYGFTLLEMLVALTVFALVSAMVYGGQVAVLKAKAGTDRQALFLKQLQGAVMMLERDIGQSVLRPVRDEFGSPEAAMQSEDYGDYRIRFTRLGWQNPLGQARSTLQRVAYGLEDEKLVRYSWAMLDRAQGSEPYKLVLLESVQAIRFRFLDQQREWHEAWPPQGGLAATGAAPVAPTPLAVELTLELAQWGEFRRVIPTPEGG